MVLLNPPNHAVNGVEASSILGTRRTSQVCDRCRLRRIKCDGQRPRCGKCERANVNCATTATLRRKTTRRGYVEPTQTIIATLEGRLEEAQAELHRTQALNQQLLHEVQFLKAQFNKTTSASLSSSSTCVVTHQGPGSFPCSTSLPPPPPPPPPPLSSTVDVSGGDACEDSIDEPVLRHLGRLVQDGYGSFFFAGSPSGIHFVLLAQRQYQKLFATQEVFPEWMFRLNLTPVLPSQGRGSVYPATLPSTSNVSHSNTNSTSSTGFMFGSLQGPDYPRDFYSRHVSTFLGTWSSLYPIFPPDQLADVDMIGDVVRTSIENGRRDLPRRFSLMAIVALNALADLYIKKTDSDAIQYSVNAHTQGRYANFLPILIYRLQP
ncbi:Fungal Zn2-Cys6 binuclear cluster domain-containing protein [Cladophialophora immunda]|nr:Fungal Zn2-Cys6 binuclear cluster domain-containing protein [Cladophialophora immunda]